MDLPVFHSGQIVAQRPAKNRVSPDRPYAWMIEPESDVEGNLQQVVTLFLTGSECPFRCTMCDLWKNTLDGPTPIGAIPQQIEFALNDLGIDPQSPQAAGVSTIKLYNSSNFFDKRAVPQEDWQAVCDLTRNFETVIVENHPALSGDAVFDFQRKLVGQLEIAMGLETTHPDVLPWLNKQMQLDQYHEAVQRLVQQDIRVRTFILVKPPSLTESQGVDWAIRSMEYAFECGVECCSMVPVRAGNGTMDQLRQSGFFEPPQVASLERVLEAGLQLRRGRVVMDLWDRDLFGGCDGCRERRLQRIANMNQTQSISPRVECDVCE